MTYYKLKITIVDILYIIGLIVGIPLIFFYVSSKGLSVISLLCISVIFLELRNFVTSKNIKKIERKLEELRASLKANNTSPDNTAGKK